MKVVILELTDALKTVIKSLFSSDMDVMTDEVREILANPDDAKKYMEAVNKIEKGEHEVTITLSNKKQLTLIQ